MGRGLLLITLAAVTTINAAGQVNAPPSAAAPAPAQTAPSTASTQAKQHFNASGNVGDYSPSAFFQNVVGDQKSIWTSPARLREVDAFWLVPLIGTSAVLFATDSDVSRHLSNSASRLNRSADISDAGVGALIGAGGGMYLWGKLADSPHLQETGFLSMESLANAMIVNNAVNLVAGRETPQVDNYRGRFFVDGRSFPSNHSAAAWSVASVIAHEYPGPFTKLLVYGLAAAVSGSRVTAKQHFPSDVLVGSAIGWLNGLHVYRAHHDPDVGGEPWNTLGETHDEIARNPNNFGSPYVALDSWIYPAIERLAALGYVDSAMLGMRPWTRLECARLLNEAEDHIDSQDTDPPSEVTHLYASLTREFRNELDLLDGGSNRAAELESLYARITGIDGQPLTDGYHFGQTIINDYGRPYEEGTNVDAGFSGWGTLGPMVGYIRGEYQEAPSAGPLSLAARELIGSVDRVPTMPPLTTPSVNRFDVIEGYVGMTWENWEISAGKQSLWWGPDAGGSMMYSNNAESQDMVRITRVSPFKLPSIFGLMGPIRVEFFIGQLSGYQFIYHEPPIGLLGQWGVPLADQPMIHGEKLSFKPTPNLEFGFDRTTIFGGAGYPVTWDTFGRSLFSLGNTAGGAPNKPGKRLSGFDMTYRLPGLRNWVTFYTDSLAYDEFTPVAYFDRSANSAGLYFPHLPKLPRFDLRVEGVYTDNPISSSTNGNLCCGFYYYNDTWRSGYTNAGNLIATWVGRDGQGAQGWLTYWLSPQSTLQFEFRHQKVSQQFITYGGTDTDGGINANVWVRPDLSVSASVQYEQWNFPVLAAGQQSDVTASVQVSYWPRWRAH